ncbi:hypothetical protein M2390_002662 [Mycetocola sp. BIGb0189]|uniref:hypothetical protein n=1 Tax=Mycetocola sp. BIGb0189 TaxID=2940604 RepID=UPI002167533B|nr:hypothetical protein [Mycetocola sp. BIGb0189]MCS4277456.1 hypothetical protein [Mycetocola sp. BIGb0189]
MSSVSSRPVDGAACIAAGLALVALFVAIVLPLGGGVVACAAIVVALVSRSNLRAHPELRGSRLGLAAFILGILVFVPTVLPPLLSLVLLSLG